MAAILEDFAILGEGLVQAVEAEVRGGPCDLQPRSKLDGQTSGADVSGVTTLTVDRPSKEGLLARAR